MELYYFCVQTIDAASHGISVLKGYIRDLFTREMITFLLNFFIVD